MKKNQIEVPLAEDLIEELISFWQTIFKTSYKYFRRLLAGAECAQNSDIIYLMRKGKELCGTCHLTISKSNPELGGIGEVGTAPDFRHMGIASTLCASARDNFRMRGGQALFLGTGNPAAARVYSRLGWRKLARANVMILTASEDSPEAFLVDYFREGGLARVAAATASMRIPMIPLIITPHDWQVLDANVGIFSTRYSVQNSCMGLYPRYDKFVRDKRAAWFGAYTARGRLVGLSTARLDRSGQCRVDGFSHQNYLCAWEGLIEAATGWGVARGAHVCWATVPVKDKNKRSLFESLGFRESGTGEEFNLDGRQVTSICLQKVAAHDPL